MFKIKRLYTFMLQQFLPLLVMTFFICLFIVMMQFLWRFIDDLVGKGLSVSVIVELFFYAALSMVPTALPLAVLLASLMAFGNLGEKFELTALKAAGISLYKIMQPLIVFMVLLSIGTFFFQNNVLPLAQTKMYTLLFSVRQKSPEVEIPERTFYDQIPGMNLYVEKKNPDTGMLYDLIIYDISKGFDNSRVILADSGKMNFTEDKSRLFLHLYQGEMFENLKDNSFGSNSSNYLPFRRESFSDKQIYFLFDANFNRIDEGAMRNQYVGKNVAELRRSIDSIDHIVDSIGDNYARDLKTAPYVNLSYYVVAKSDSGNYAEVKRQPVKAAPLDLDSLYAALAPASTKPYLAQALSKAKRQKQDYEFRSAMALEQAKLSRRHGIELQRKFTLPVACLVFFFIGAPLGAIIKKGGIGTPLVVSVFLFIIYYIFDNSGYKMARDGRMNLICGIWLSTVVMMPLGIFFTYKAVGDSAVFNLDAYKLALGRIFGRRMHRTLSLKEVILNDVDPSQAREMLTQFLAEAQKYLQLARRPWLQRMLKPAKYGPLNMQMTNLVDYLSDTHRPRVVSLLNNYPFSIMRRDLPGIVDTTRRLLDIYAPDDSPQN